MSTKVDNLKALRDILGDLPGYRESALIGPRLRYFSSPAYKLWFEAGGTKYKITLNWPTKDCIGGLGIITHFDAGVLTDGRTETPIPYRSDALTIAKRLRAEHEAKGNRQ